MKILLVVLVIIAAVIVGPMVTIWSLNTLFPSLNIDINLNTWMATVWILATIQAAAKAAKKS